MSLVSRFFGTREPDDAPDALVGDGRERSGAALQLLFATDRRLDEAIVTPALRAYHPTMAGGRCEFEKEWNREGKLFGLAGWGDHVVKMVGFNIPMPRDSVELCVAPAHYPQPLKTKAREHKAHVLLWYAGKEKSPLEQYIALAALAGAMGRFGGVVVLNETARTSFPVGALSGDGVACDILGLLKTFPLPLLFCGFVKYNPPAGAGTWMRTYGAHVFGLPDLAVYAAGHHEGQRYLDMFDTILRYMLDSGKHLAAGHTMQVGPSDYLRCRAPRPEEEWLRSEGAILLVEFIGPDQINK